MMFTLKTKKIKKVNSRKVYEIYFFLLHIYSQWETIFAELSPNDIIPLYMKNGTYRCQYCPLCVWIMCNTTMSVSIIIDQFYCSRLGKGHHTNCVCSFTEIADSFSFLFVITNSGVLPMSEEVSVFLFFFFNLYFIVLILVL